MRSYPWYPWVRIIVTDRASLGSIRASYTPSPSWRTMRVFFPVLCAAVYASSLTCSVFQKTTFCAFVLCARRSASRVPALLFALHFRVR